VKNKCTLHNFVVLAVNLPKIIKVSKKLIKLWRKQFWLFFSETRCSLLSKFYWKWCSHLVGL